MEMSQALITHQPPARTELNLTGAAADMDHQSEAKKAIGDPIGDPLVILPDTEKRDWISIDNFSELTGISYRNSAAAVKNAAEGKPWRGHPLHVRKLEGGRGGAGGIRYEVAALSLPEELQTKWYARFIREAPAIPGLPAATTGKNGAAIPAQHLARAKWLYALIRPALLHPKHSPGRSKAVKELAEKEHSDWQGKPRTFSSVSLYKHIECYEKAGLAGLVRKPRSDVSAERYLLFRVWDMAMRPLLEAKKSGLAQAVAEEFTRHARGLWANGVAGWREAQSMGQAELARLTATGLERRLDLGNESAPTHARYGMSALEFRNCQPSRSFVEAQREYRLLYIKEYDAKKWFDKIAPRVKRQRGGILPMDVVIGDVHPVDIKLMRALLDAGVRANLGQDELAALLEGRGDDVTARAIAWQDLATNRVWIDLIVLPPREAVRREHVAFSFSAMAGEWGCPRTLYLDNGGEYSWVEMIEPFTEMSRLMQDFKFQWLRDDGDVQGARREVAQAIVRAMPYNAPAKPIEGLFSVLESVYFNKLAGWIGGNRMTKKTHNVGKTPRPYTGTFEQFHGDIAQCLNYYHSRPQQGALGGKSPWQALEDFIEEGWKAVKIDPDMLRMVFAFRDTRAVQPGGYIRWDNRWFHHEELAKHVKVKGVQGKLNVRLPSHDPSCLFVELPGGQWLTAGPAPYQGFVGDSAGPEFKAKLEKSLRVYLHDLKGDCGRIYWRDEMAAQMAARPEIPAGPQLTLAEAEKMQAALEQSAARITQEAAQAQGAKVVSQWISSAEVNSVVDGVKWTED
jgi:hypothetical protein